MTPILWTLTLGLLACGDSDYSSKKGPPKPNPLAPSLPLLTEKEEDFLDKIIDRFILFDTGLLRGEEGRRALVDFQKLGPEAIPALIRGLNRAAKIEASCPAVTIGRKLATLFKKSNDPELLDFARENIGAGVTQSQHMGVLKDLRVTCMFRKRAIGQRASFQVAPVPAYLRAVTLPRLTIKPTDLEPGPRRDQLAKELAKRPPSDVLTDLGTIAADGSDAEIQKQAREVLEEYLSQRDVSVLRNTLQDGLVEVRAAAARVVGKKGLHFERELIELLGDIDADLRHAARAALVKLNPSVDFGPERDDSLTERTKAVERWRDWLAKRGGR